MCVGWSVCEREMEMVCFSDRVSVRFSNGVCVMESECL